MTETEVSIDYVAKEEHRDYSVYAWGCPFCAWEVEGKNLRSVKQSQLRHMVGFHQIKVPAYLPVVPPKPEKPKVVKSKP